MTRFDIGSIVSDVGEQFTMSGVSSTFDIYGDPTESYTNYVLSGVVEVMDGSEEEVIEGILNKEDLIVYVDEDETEVGNIVVENYFTINGANAKGTYRIVNVIHNAGHYEAHAKRVLKG